jgi:Lon protease-like protein
VQQPDANSGGFRAEGFEAVGTQARIVALEQPQPGLLLMACEGGERFRIERSEKLKHGLWVADVALLPQDHPNPVPPELQTIPRALHQLHERLQAEHPGALGALPPYPGEHGPWQDAGWVANRWAELLPLPPNFKQRLLALDSPLLRLELVGDALEQLGIAY